MAPLKTGAQGIYTLGSQSSHYSISRGILDKAAMLVEQFRFYDFNCCYYLRSLFRVEKLSASGCPLKFGRKVPGFSRLQALIFQVVGIKRLRANI
ncbi:hypothetical protein AVEN_160288-1 [Araneus ventricosus]|uniref:Uncharacterized protein n=1 Tax=Araneus ventricosus TaxID=182803 RepID=A0A4Y2JR22_ARAVE|nr:hypothetical protein AVEN_160288-1 [Araneus ventricosus]